MKVLYELTKVLGIVVGGILSVLALMAIVGTMLSAFWPKLGIACVVALGIPIFVADRLLPDDDPTAGKGIPTEVLSIFLTVVPFLYFGLLGNVTSTWTMNEASQHSSVLGRVLSVLGHSDKPASDSQVEDTPLRQDAGPPDASPSDASIPDAMTPEPSKEVSKTVEQKTSFTTAELFAKWAPSVVSIQTGNGSGTGFLVDSKGSIATNHHVLGDKPTGVKVKLHDGTFAAKVWLEWSDAEADLAIIRISTSKLPSPVKLADSDKVKVGEQAIAIGNPLGLDHTLTDGVVSSRRVFRGKKMIQMSTPVSPGNSGGPLFMNNGEVVGVVSQQVGGFMGRAQNLNLAIPSNELLERIKNKKNEHKRIGGGPGEEKGTW